MFSTDLHRFAVVWMIADSVICERSQVGKVKVI